MNSIGQRIKIIRINNNLSQKNLSEKLNISQSTVGHYENNTRNPPIDKLIKISNIGNVSLDWLLKGKNTGNNIFQNKIAESDDNYNIDEYKYLKNILEKDKKLKKLVFSLVKNFNNAKKDLQNINNYLNDL